MLKTPAMFNLALDFLYTYFIQTGSSALSNTYRIAGKFGGEKVWRIHCYELLARKSLAIG